MKMRGQAELRLIVWDIFHLIGLGLGLGARLGLGMGLNSGSAVTAIIIQICTGARGLCSIHRMFSGMQLLPRTMHRFVGYRCLPLALLQSTLLVLRTESRHMHHTHT